jgi:hypothetical protein
VNVWFLREGRLNFHQGRQVIHLFIMLAGWLEGALGASAVGDQGTFHAKSC